MSLFSFSTICGQPAEPISTGFMRRAARLRLERRGAAVPELHEVERGVEGRGRVDAALLLADAVRDGLAGRCRPWRGRGRTRTRACRRPRAACRGRASRRAPPWPGRGRASSGIGRMSAAFIGLGHARAPPAPRAASCTQARIASCFSPSPSARVPVHGHVRERAASRRPSPRARSSRARARARVPSAAAAKPAGEVEVAQARLHVALDDRLRDRQPRVERRLHAGDVAARAAALERRGRPSRSAASFGGAGGERRARGRADEQVRDGQERARGRRARRRPTGIFFAPGVMSDASWSREGRVVGPGPLQHSRSARCRRTVRAA